MIERIPVAFGGAHPFTGWFHRDPAAFPTGQVAVICGPVGYEYTRAYRSLRHLAERFARSGIPALRFDYHGIGDSPGDDLDPGRLAAWESNVRDALRHFNRGQTPFSHREKGAPARVILVGVRLGATLAARVASEIPVERLVLWNPVVTGRPYLRELQAIAASAAKVQCDVEGAFEAAGFVMSAETQQSIRAIDLRAATPAADRILLAHRDDLAPDETLAAVWRDKGLAVDTRALPGWAGMMAEHQFTVVPKEALDAIIAWAWEEDSAPTAPPVAPPAIFRPNEFPVTFDGLAGVLHKPQADSAKPAIVMFNAGAVHHVGPNRIYVEMARRLAREGYPCLRFDLEGLGDSALFDRAQRENHPYPDWATRDARCAFRFLREQHGYSRFIALGLCSGAHTAFHAGLEIDDEAIEQLVLINPLTFRWVEGMSLETTTRVYDEMAYRKSMKDPKRWMKLLRGDVNFKRLFAVAAAYPGKIARRAWDAACETFIPPLAPPLARQLRQLEARARPITFFIADGDPGYELLEAGAPRTTARQLADGTIRMVRIRDADHTFSQRVPRAMLVAKLVEALCAVPAGKARDVRVAHLRAPIPAP